MTELPRFDGYESPPLDTQIHVEIAVNHLRSVHMVVLLTLRIEARFDETLVVATSWI